MQLPMTAAALRGARAKCTKWVPVCRACHSHLHDHNHHHNHNHHQQHHHHHQQQHHHHHQRSVFQDPATFQKWSATTKISKQLPENRENNQKHKAQPLPPAGTLYHLYHLLHPSTEPTRAVCSTTVEYVGGIGCIRALNSHTDSAPTPQEVHRADVLYRQ